MAVYSMIDTDKAFVKEHARRIGGHSATPCIVTDCAEAIQPMQEGCTKASVHLISDVFEGESIDLLFIDNLTLQNAVVLLSKVRLGGVVFFCARAAALFWLRYLSHPLWGLLKSPDTFLVARRLDVLQEREPIPEKSPKWWLHGEHRTFFLKVSIMQQWADLLLWEVMLSANSDLRTVIELGTSAGGMAIFLCLQTLQRGMNFWTFDINRPLEVDKGKVAQCIGLADCFQQADLLSDKGQAKVIKFLQDPSLHPMLLFIDLFKPRMFGEFAPYLQKGDMIAVHDFNGQFFHHHTGPMQGRVAPYMCRECEEVGGITRFWRVVT